LHRHKKRPTEILCEQEPSLDIICAALRAEKVDIQELKKQVENINEERWSEQYQRDKNVALRRPFHDKLGVNKIICIFSDNHLDNVYYLPEWNNWKQLLEPIFAAAGVKHMHQVVRCLLARLPGNTLIPAHHDNGLWVAKTHRIHVPIITFPEVDFRSGIAEESMTRFAFNEGSIVELNNAAKHSVFNGADSYRVHIIFDIIESHLPPPTAV